MVLATLRQRITHVFFAGCLVGVGYFVTTAMIGALAATGIGIVGIYAIAIGAALLVAAFMVGGCRNFVDIFVGNN